MIAEAALGERRITGVFKIGDPESFLAMLSDLSTASPSNAVPMVERKFASRRGEPAGPRRALGRLLPDGPESD